MTMPAPVSQLPPVILVVDDEPDLRTLYELTLLREGYRVEAAGTWRRPGKCWKSPATTR